MFSCVQQLAHSRPSENVDKKEVMAGRLHNELTNEQIPWGDLVWAESQGVRRGRVEGQGEVPALSLRRGAESGKGGGAKQ